MRILHVVANIENEAAGPSVSVPRLAEAQARMGASVLVATVGDPTKPDVGRTTVPHHIYAHTAAGFPILSRLKLSFAMHAMLKETPSSFDVVHSHGLWLAPNVYPVIAAKNGARWVVSPRGMLGPAALQFSALKKKAFWTLAQRPALEHAHLIHVTSDQEAREVQEAGIATPLAVVPNGVDLRPLAPNSERPRRTILSLGRLHPKKGLSRLIDAWVMIGERFPDWNVRIVGPDEGGHANELRARIAAAGISRISVEGPLFGLEKEAAYRQAGLFALPTLNENFAMTVAEALAAETPVVSTKGAPWEGLDVNDCGRWIEHGAEAMAAALTDLLALDDSVRTAMGRRGREWMAAEFSWDSVARRLDEAYRSNFDDWSHR